MQTHRQIDDRSLAMHRLIAEKIRRDPELLGRARATLQRWRGVVSSGAQPYLAEWEGLLDRGMDASLAVAVEESEHAAALRQCSPLACLLSNQERFAFLKAWGRGDEA